MGLSFVHLLVLLIVVLIVFGAGRLPQVMGDLGKGIRNFKAGLNGDTPDHAEKIEKLEKKADDSADSADHDAKHPHA